MTGGAAMLAGIAAIMLTAQSAALSPSALTAATALGDRQGVPGGFTGHLYPDYTNCYVNYSAGQYAEAYGPLCRDNKETYFWSGIFSINGASTPSVGQSAYLASTISDLNNYDPSGYLGAAPASGYYCPTNTGEMPRYAPAEVVSQEGGDQYRCNLGDGSSGPAEYLNPPECRDFYAVPPQDDYVGRGNTSATSSGCYSYKLAPTIQTAVRTAGTAPVVAAGAPLTLQWSCLPSHSVSGEQKTGQSWNSSGSWQVFKLYAVTLSNGTTAVGPGFSAGGLTGTRTVTAPSAPGTYNYALTCNSSWSLPAMTISVTVTDTPPPPPPPSETPPSLSITGNGKSGTVSVAVGTPVAIEATFVPHGTDALVHTAINDGDNNALTDWQPASQRSYGFTPSAPGTYTFYPAVQTNQYPAWNNYGEQLIVVAQSVECRGDFQNAVLCPGDAADVASRLVSSCSQPSGSAPKCEWTCDVLHHKVGNTCVLNVCTGVHEDSSTYPACDCMEGYVKENGICVPIPPALSLMADPTRVRAGNATTLSWNVDNLVGDGSQTCRITSSPAGVFSAASNGTETSWSGSRQTGPIESKTVFTLACPSAAPISVTVDMIPTVKEI